MCRSLVGGWRTDPEGPSLGSLLWGPWTYGRAQGATCDSFSACEKREKKQSMITSRRRDDAHFAEPPCWRRCSGMWTENREVLFRKPLRFTADSAPGTCQPARRQGWETAGFRGPGHHGLCAGTALGKVQPQGQHAMESGCGSRGTPGPLIRKRLGAQHTRAPRRPPPSALPSELQAVSPLWCSMEVPLKPLPLSRWDGLTCGLDMGRGLGPEPLCLGPVSNVQILCAGKTSQRECGCWRVCC